MGEKKKTHRNQKAIPFKLIGKFLSDGQRSLLREKGKSTWFCRNLMSVCVSVCVRACVGSEAPRRR